MAESNFWGEVGAEVTDGAKVAIRAAIQRQIDAQRQAQQPAPVAVAPASGIAMPVMIGGGLLAVAVVGFFVFRKRSK